MKTKEDTSKPVINSIVSLFSGGGFLDIGFMNNGFRIQEAIEIEPEFIKAYNYAVKNYLDSSNKSALKREGAKYKAIAAPVNASSRKEQDAIAKRNIGITGIIGGPPCQDYSVGGSNAGIEGKKGRLIHSYLNIVRKTKPSFLVFENVEGLYKTAEHKKAFLSFVNKIEKEGYSVWHNVLNILEYGYAQDRPRIVLVAFKKKIVHKLVKAGYTLENDNQKLGNGIKKAVFKWPAKVFENPKEIDWPEKWGFRSKARTADLEDIPEEFESLQVKTAFEGLNYSTPNQREYFNPKSDKFNFIDEGDTDRKSFKRLHRYRYSPTVAYGNNEVHLHPTKARRLTVREALRLQTVPDSYVLPKDIPLTYKFKLISNGVPTALADLIAKEIKRTLNIYNKIQSTNGHLVKEKKKLGNVQNPVKKHKAGKTASFPTI